ncbi:hypothetical protein [Petrotoga sp. 9PWA.NaAc.5.4]|uniref:hypothetical protein n=1 Tax=Petrotoga sp. 9PWA.NaAc.5.4 TaxID=1434328 RepID=UPI000CA954E3|nr:hypothetical protein [Petrotoga sp. 9PWA.NaAc.5.4]PNR97013.1 hypothetical protein X924_00325 [Petrotoga sp. 9PWA.NaAc.5.4]
MKIENYDIQMNANRLFFSKQTKEEKLLYWRGERPQQQENENKVDLQKIRQKLKNDIKVLIEDMKSMYKQVDGKHVEEIDLDEIDIDAKEKLKLKLLQQMLEKLTGKKINFSFIKDMEKLKKSIESIEAKASEIKKQFFKKDQPQAQGYSWGLEYDSLIERLEYEKVEYSAIGIVKTSDGKEINIAISLLMERSMLEKELFSLRMGDAVDPLVINFEGTAAELTERKFDFDLNADGINELINFVGKGSGFLVLDKNSDGKINDGKELFGPQTGNGFEELAKYDEDKNGWIDENDSIFNDLKLWVKTIEGEDVLLSLKDKEIGAIYLGSVSSEFSIKRSIDDVLGVIRNTGIFLKEYGGVGIIQHLDLYV